MNGSRRTEVELAGDMHGGCSIDFMYSSTTIGHVIHVSLFMRTAIKMSWMVCDSCKVVFRAKTVQGCIKTSF
jgi:hypothetical protein